MSYLKVRITAAVGPDHDHFEVWRHTADLAANVVHLVATRVGEDVRDRLFVDPDVIGATVYWYWARAIDKWDNRSAMVALGSATAAVLNGQMSSDRLLGRDSAGVGPVEEIEAGAGLAFTGGPGIGIADRGVTVAMLPEVASGSILGRATAAAGDLEVLTAAGARAVIECGRTYAPCAVADLPAAAAGDRGFATDGLKAGETAGTGTGCAVYHDGTAWRRGSDDTTVAA